MGKYVMLAGYIFLMTVGKPAAQPAPPDDVDEIMQAFLERSQGGYADMVPDNVGANFLGIDDDDDDFSEQVLITNQRQDVD